MFNLNFEVVRHRPSVTQGEAEVFCNGISIERYGDTIRLNGHINVIDGYGSTIEDEFFVKAALRHKNYKILKCITKIKSDTTTFNSLEEVYGEDEQVEMRRLHSVRTEDLTGENFDF